MKLHFDKRLPYWAIVIATAIIAAIPCIIYALRFYQLPAANDPAGFSAFGDYIGGVSGLTLGVLNIWLVAYIALKLGKIEEESETKRSLLALLREWNSHDMYLSRTRAFNLIRENPSLSIAELSVHHQIDSTPLWVVLHFFQDLEVAVSVGIVSKNDAVKAFGQILDLLQK